MADLGRVDVAQLDASLLADDERARAARLRRPAERRGYLAAHVLLRELLGERLGVSPRDVAYVREPCPACGAPHGRPALDRPVRPLHFSLSRRGDLVLVGMAPTPIGVDVEALPDQLTVAEVSALLHPAERAEVLAATPSERPARFARLWARKEAYLKGVGTGIATDLAAEYVGEEQRASGPRGWRVLDVPAPAGHAAAVAVALHPRAMLAGARTPSAA